MKFVDTNVLIRFIINNPPVQAMKVQAMVQAASIGELAITDAVLAETCQVLEFHKMYQLKREFINPALAGLLRLNVFTVSSLAQQSIQYYTQNSKLDFVDCLLLAQAKLYADEVVSFDKSLLKALATLKG